MYVDPNTGGMLFQILAVIFVFFSGMILVFSSRIKMLWARLRRKNSPPAGQADKPDQSA